MMLSEGDWGPGEEERLERPQQVCEGAKEGRGGTCTGLKGGKRGQRSRMRSCIGFSDDLDAPDARQKEERRGARRS